MPIPLVVKNRYEGQRVTSDLLLRCLFCFFALLCFVFRLLYAFVEAAALRSLVLRYTGAPIATRVSYFFPIGDVAFSEYFLYHFRFLSVWIVRRTFFPSVWCFSYLVTSGWIFYISLCKNLISKSINHDVFFVFSSHSFWILSPLDVPAGVIQDFSSTFLLRCVPEFFSREGVSHSFPSSTVKSNFVY